VIDPRLQLSAIEARHRELASQAEGDRLAQEARQAQTAEAAQPQAGGNVLVGLGDFLIAAGLRLKGQHETLKPGETAVAFPSLAHGLRSVPEMALRIWQVEGEVAYSLTYCRLRTPGLREATPGTYYTLTWLGPARDLAPAPAPVHR
jgi:hypothetical protein